MFLIPIALLVAAALYAIKLYRQFRKHLADAQASGIPYQIVPFFLVNRLFQVSCIFLLPIFRKLPKSWTESWLPLVVEWGWARRYEPFARIGSDTFLTVSPERNVLYTAEASVIHQITNRRNDFPKALEVYKSLLVFGTNVVTTEGAEWRHHRKIVSPPFTEKNNHLVWEETLAQAQAMIDGWFGTDKERSKTVRTAADDAMRLSLHIISKAGFGVSMAWPGLPDESGQETRAANLEHGHTMTYTDALGILLHNMVPVILIPRLLLKYLPTKTTRLAYTSYTEWRQYMREVYNDKKAKILAGQESEHEDLMTAMLKSADVTAHGSAVEDGKKAEQSMTDEEILGNAFVFILAGHETTANSIHFCLIYLAMHISSQRRLQQDLDKTFQGRPISEWSYEEDIPMLFGNMAGAVLNEELRLIPPVVGIPKRTGPGKPQSLIVGGKKCIVPENTYISLVCHSAHRNPNQWPTGPPANLAKPSHPLSNTDNDLEEFKPERWFISSDREETAAKLTDDLATDTTSSLFKPEKGAYIPFSDGFRSCIGRRFAQVELLAFLALVFSQYSVELSLEDWASDEQVEKWDHTRRRQVWELAKTKVENQMINDMASVITLQLRKGHVPLRLVKRGKEMFDWT